MFLFALRRNWIRQCFNTSKLPKEVRKWYKNCGGGSLLFCHFYFRGSKKLSFAFEIISIRQSFEYSDLSEVKVTKMVREYKLQKWYVEIFFTIFNFHFEKFFYHRIL